MNNVRIERATIEERELIHDFFETVIRHTFDENGITEEVYSWKEELAYKKLCLQEDYDSRGDDRAYFIAKKDGFIIGSVEIGPANDDILQGTNNLLAGKMEVGTVFVHPNHQRQGISLLLFETAVDELRARGYSSYCFDSGYPIAQQIWTRRFGPATHLLKDYWGQGADHMVWVREITV